jgi:ribonuclease P protein component
MHILKENMTKIDRLKKRSDFLYVQKNGKKWVAKGLIIEVCPNNLSHNRFGITVSKKISKSAVTRNRIKRRLRAVAYEVLPFMNIEGLDCVLIGRKDSDKRSFNDLKKDLIWSLKKLDIYSKGEDKL